MTPRKYALGKRAEAVEETRRKIIDATFELHGTKGIVATSMQDVADRADVSLRTVYNHFPTIDDLVGGCGAKVMSVLAPPTPDTFAGLQTFDARVKRLVGELFAMYERAPEMIEVARCEQAEVPRLKEFVSYLAASHKDLVSEALRPFKPRSQVAAETTALTDFYVWKAFTDQAITTRQAADLICRSLVALANPDTVSGRKDNNDDDR
jgi:AcrR family transcriptional regulator